MALWAYLYYYLEVDMSPIISSTYFEREILQSSYDTS